MNTFFTRNAERVTEDVAARAGAGVETAEYIGRRQLRNFASIELDRITVDGQHRETFDQESLKHLAASMAEHGQKQPVRVRWDATRELYVVIAGERRYRAAQLAGWDTLECSVAPDDISADDVLIEQITENALRVDLAPSERAKAYRDLMARKNWFASQVATALHVNKSTVSRLLQLNDMADELRSKVDAGDASLEDAIRAHKAAGAQPAIERAPRKKRPAKQIKLTIDGGFTVAVKARKLLNNEAIICALQLAIAKVQAKNAA